MALIERHRELTTLTRLYADCVRARGRVALVSGGVASGKTALLAEFAEHMVADGAILLTATGARAEHAVPFGVVTQLAQSPALPRAVADHISDLLSGDGSAAIEATTATADPVAIGRAGARVLDGVCAALLDLAKDRPVVIEVDDVQFADGPSQQALLYLHRRMRFARVLVVLTEWALPRPTQAAFRAEVTRQPNTTHLRLAPLTRAGVADLLATRLDPAAARALAPALHAVSGGNPLLVKALIDDQSAGTEHRARVAVGREFAQGVLACLHRWEPVLPAAARAVALLGDAGTPDLVGALLEITPDSAAQALDVLVTAGLLDDDKRFRHPVAATTVLDTLTPAERGASHLRAAHLLYHQGAPADAVATHLTAADTAHGRAAGGEREDHAELADRGGFSDSGDLGGPWAVAVLRHAAREDLVADRVELAVRRLELAARACADDAERADITTLLLRVEWRRDPSAAARHLAPLRAARSAGRLADHNAVHLAKFLLWYGHTEELAGTLAGMAAAGELPAAGQFSLVFHWLAFLYPPVVAGVPAPLPDQQAPVLADPWTRASAMLDRVRVGGARAEIVTAAEHILQSCRLGEQTLGSQLSALAALVHADRNDRAAHWCAALLADATARGALTWQAVLGALRAEIALRQGDLPAAAEHARVAFDRLTGPGWGVAVGVPLSTRVAAATAMGKHDEAAALLRAPVPDAMFQTQFGLHYLHARGMHYLATDKPHAALGDFQRCGELMTGWDLDLPTLVPWRSGAAQALLALGHRDDARALAAEQLTRPGNDGARTRGLSLRVLAAASPPDRRVGLLQEAVELLRAGGDRCELARALLDLSQAHNTTGDGEKARTLARRALQLAKACGAGPVNRDLVSRAALARAPLPEPSDHDAGLSTLSEAERRVAVLAALGHTNREIGGKLYITVSTVEQHLTRVYRKLKVTRRTDLPAGLPGQLLAAADER
ncbi:helix-turn-helix transcriptional regulator [Actinokineospora iranica]|uniref:Regulatory protein, luxR family n=1 Tax=Actinokineospora iranica TaxID=1271860 RepID=A0A1G6MDI9_9PSEU|nr:LuxR family transcriptional regulator [Actinokineospora iranica]SDC53015.1 regulatory protein, luxR family [Actinokineospora iranica]